MNGQICCTLISSAAAAFAAGVSLIFSMVMPCPYRPSRRSAARLAFAVCILCGWPGYPHAAETYGPSSGPPASAASAREAALLDLRRSFREKLGGDMEEADLYLQGAGKLELAEHRAGTVLPDNEPLLLHGILASEGIDLNQDIYSIKQKHALLVSLADFAQATGLPIKVDEAKGTAAGWFVRQSQTFSLDAKNRMVVIQGKSQPVAPEDIAEDGGLMLVSAALLEKWFDLDFDYDFAGLALLIKSKDPLPAEQAWLRSQRQGQQRFSNAAARLPYMKQSYGLISEPYIDTDINGRILHSPGAPPDKSANWSTIMSGDLAGFSAQAFLSGTDTRPYIDTARITLGKEDATANLLGPLHATKYSFGDINTASSTVIGGGALEQGAYVTNKPVNGVTTQTSTTIRGTAKPGWDVELYRNESYIDIRHVGTDGLYDFGTVDLQYGDNDFKFVFYGPQGEALEEHRHVGVNANAVSSSGNYEASVSRRGVSTIQAGTQSNTSSPDYGTLHEVANYERGFGRLGTVSLGTNSFTRNGEKKLFGQAGLATYQLGTFINTDVGVDAGNGATSTVVTARRNFGKHSATLQYTASDRQFNSSASGSQFAADATASTTGGGTSTGTASTGTGDAAPESPTRWILRLGLSGPLAGEWLPKNHIYYNLSTSHTDLYSGGKTDAVNGSLSSRLGPASVTGNVSYSNSTSAGGATTENATAGFSGRTFLMGGSLRATALYQVKPQFQMQQDTLEYDHTLGNNLDSTTTLTYTPRPSVTSLEERLNWRTPYAMVSPTFAIDSRHNARAGVDVHFAVGADPYSGMYGVYDSYLTGVGGVAARIFTDKNGNGVYDEGDVLLPGVTLIAGQLQKSALSNDKGIAFIPDMPENQLTDIEVDPTSSSDAYGISMFKGASIRPHPGVVAQMEFPIVEGGEMDGQADFKNDDGTRIPARGVKISLIAPDGRVEQSADAAGDGYWSISGIRPGVYYLVASSTEDKPGFAMPRLVEIKPEGTTLFGQPVVMTPGHDTVINFTAENDPPDGPTHARTIRPSDIAGQSTKIELGGFKSRLAMGIAWYRMRLRDSQWTTLFDVVTPIGKIQPDKKTGLLTMVLKPKISMPMQDAVLACRAVRAENFTCAVDVITRYRKYAPPGKMKDIAMGDMRGSKTFTRKLPPSVRVIADFNDYARRNPIVEKEVNDETVILNLGSYNSREMMVLVWYKVKKNYNDIIGGARLLVQPADSYASARTGKHILRAVFTDGDMQEAEGRCQRLAALGQPCTVEVAPEEPLKMSSNGATTLVHAARD